MVIDTDTEQTRSSVLLLESKFVGTRAEVLSLLANMEVVSLYCRYTGGSGSWDFGRGKRSGDLMRQKVCLSHIGSAQGVS